MWDESKHKRDEKGKFTYNNSSDGFGGTHKATIAEKKRLKELGLSDNNSLSKKEYRMWYDRLGEIKNQNHYVNKMPDGKMLVKLQDNETHCIVVTYGSFQNPKIKTVIRFANDDEIDDFIENVTGDNDDNR